MFLILKVQFMGSRKISLSFFYLFIGLTIGKRENRDKKINTYVIIMANAALPFHFSFTISIN